MECGLGGAGPVTPMLRAPKQQRVLDPPPPADAIEPPRLRPNEVQVYTADQVQQLLEKARGRVLFVPCALALLTGMRRSEVFALRWSDILFEQRVLYVRQSVEITEEYGLRFKKPKSNKPRRITLPSTLIEILERHREQQEAHRDRMGEGYRDLDLVCPLDDGNIRNPHWFSQDFARFVRSTGLPPIKFHGLRHTHATLMLTANVPLKVASERLGHASVRLTGDLYTHVLDDMQQGVADKLDEIVPFEL